MYAIQTVKTITVKKPGLVAYHSLMASHVQYRYITWTGAENIYLKQKLTIVKKTIGILNDLPYNYDSTVVQ